MKKKIFAVTLVVALVFTSSCAPKQQSQKNKQAVGGVESSIFGMGNIEKIRVVGDNANIRSGCSNNSPVIHSPSKNSTYDVVGPVADWFAVKAPNNQIGFIPKNQSKPIISDSKTPVTTPSTSGSTPQGATAPKTPNTPTNSTSLTSEEQQMVKLVNAARAQNNLPPLQVDMQVENVARTKAQDMIDNNYFSHNSPKYGSPFDMMKSFGVKFVHAGENIAGNQSVQAAHNALMNSPGHRQNILSPDYTHIGIGIRKGGPYGYMFSQMFVSEPK